MFWTFAFPVLLTIALGIAFRSRPPEPVRAAVERGPGAERIAAALAAGRGVTAEVLEAPAAAGALRTGRVAIVVVPGSPPAYRHDPARPESRLARAVVDDLLRRAAGRTDPLAPRDVLVTEPGTWGIGWVIVEDRIPSALTRKPSVNPGVFAFLGRAVLDDRPAPVLVAAQHPNGSGVRFARSDMVPRTERRVPFSRGNGATRGPVRGPDHHPSAPTASRG